MSTLPNFHKKSAYIIHLSPIRRTKLVFFPQTKKKIITLEMRSYLLMSFMVNSFESDTIDSWFKCPSFLHQQSIWHPSGVVIHRNLDNYLIAFEIKISLKKIPRRIKSLFDGFLRWNLRFDHDLSVEWRKKNWLGFFDRKLLRTVWWIVWIER